MGWRHVAADPVTVTRKPVVRFGIVAGVSYDVADPSSPDGRAEQSLELIDIGPGAAAGLGRKDQVAARIARQTELRKPMVCHVLDGLGDVGPPLDEIAAGVPRFEASGVDGGDRDPTSPSACSPTWARRNGRIEQGRGRRDAEQPLGRLLKGRPMWRSGHLDRCTQVGAVGEQPRNPAVIEGHG
jgi:hypothetical protein